jgi:hypothetical protein
LFSKRSRHLLQATPQHPLKPNRPDGRFFIACDQPLAGRPELRLNFSVAPGRNSPFAPQLHRRSPS